MLRKLGYQAKVEVQRAGLDITKRAKMNSPVDTGHNRQSIAVEFTGGGYIATITANAAYAPFIEFGTGSGVSVPAGFESLAVPFKGAGVRQVNRRAHPFLIPAFMEGREDMIKRVKQLLGLDWK